MNFRLALLAALALCFTATAQTQHKPTTPPASKPSDDSQHYSNATFGFRYRIPYGWVERTKEVQEGNDAAKSEVLLAVFERPPQAAGDTINAAVVIAAEKAAAYPGLKKAEDCLGLLTKLMISTGFKADGDPSAVEINSRQLVRADFVKPRNDKLTMHQSTLVLFAKGQIVSFTFIAGSADEVEQALAGLSFTTKVAPARH